MKTLSEFINEELSKDLKDQATAYSVDHEAGKFYRKNLIEVLKYIHDYKSLDDVAINAYDPKHPHTMAYKYAGLENGTMKLQYNRDDDFVNKDLYKKLIDDLESCKEDIIKTEFDNGVRYVQSATVMQDDFVSKDLITLIFEG